MAELPEGVKAVTPKSVAVSNVLANLVTETEITETIGQEILDEAQRLLEAYQRIPHANYEERAAAYDAYQVHLEEHSIPTRNKEQAIAKRLDEVRGLTRDRVAAVLSFIKAQVPIPEELLTQEPAINDLVKEYLQAYGITDRISFHAKMFGYSEDGTVCGFYKSWGIGGLFPKNLMQMVLGRKWAHTNPTRLEVSEIGDKLYGPLDTGELAERLRELFAQHDIHSRDDLIGTPYREVTSILKGFTINAAPQIMEAFLNSGERFQMRGHGHLQRIEMLADHIY